MPAIINYILVALISELGISLQKRFRKGFDVFDRHTFEELKVSPSFNSFNTGGV